RAGRPGRRARRALPRRPVRVERRDAGGVRLLGPRDVRVRTPRHPPAALQRLPVVLRPPDRTRESATRRHRLLPREPQRTAARGDVHRRGRIHPRAAHRGRRQGVEPLRHAVRADLRRRGAALRGGCFALVVLDLDAGVRIEDLPDAEVDLELVPRRGAGRKIDVEETRRDDQHRLPQAFEEGCQTVRVARIGEAKLHRVAATRVSHRNTRNALTRSSDTRSLDRVNFYAGISSSTLAAWPAGLMPSIARATLPSRSMRNVERLMPKYFLPARFFSPQTP